MTIASEKHPRNYATASTGLTFLISVHSEAPTIEQKREKTVFSPKIQPSFPKFPLFYLTPEIWEYKGGNNYKGRAELVAISNNFLAVLFLSGVYFRSIRASTG